MQALRQRDKGEAKIGCESSIRSISKERSSVAQMCRRGRSSGLPSLRTFKCVRRCTYSSFELPAEHLSKDNTTGTAAATSLKQSTAGPVMITLLSHSCLNVELAPVVNEDVADNRKSDEPSEEVEHCRVVAGLMAAVLSKEALLDYSSQGMLDIPGLR